MKNLGGARSVEYSETISTGMTGESVCVHPINNKSGVISCTVVSSGNVGKFQTTTSTTASILSDTATWSDWANGDVTVTTTDVLLGPVTGIRGVSISGEITIEIVA